MLVVTPKGIAFAVFLLLAFVAGSFFVGRGCTRPAPVALPPNAEQLLKTGDSLGAIASYQKVQLALRDSTILNLQRQLTKYDAKQRAIRATPSSEWSDDSIERYVSKYLGTPLKLHRPDRLNAPVRSAEAQVPKR